MKREGDSLHTFEYISCPKVWMVAANSPDVFSSTCDKLCKGALSCSALGSALICFSMATDIYKREISIGKLETAALSSYSHWNYTYSAY